VNISTILKVVLKALGPALLGFSTIFRPKANSTNHWSTNLRSSFKIEASTDESRGQPWPAEDHGLKLETTAASRTSFANAR